MGVIMAVGFVLIKVGFGAENKVHNTLGKLEEILESYLLFGDYDLIAKIQATDYKELSNIVIHKIQAIKDITEIKTLILA